MSIRVVVAEDQGMVLGALVALLEIEKDIEVVGRAQDGQDGQDVCFKTMPDVLVTDIEMPGMTGLELAASVKKALPKTRIIILTTFARAGYLRRALDSGATGYLLKDAPSEKLADAVRRVHAGLRVIDPELAQEAWGDPDPLSDVLRSVRLRGSVRPGGAGAAPGGRRPDECRHRCNPGPLRRHGAELPL